MSCSVLQATAQVLVPTSESAFELEHNFNSLTIKTKGIRKITYEIIDKRDFEVAVDKNLSEIYEFNSDGQVSRYYYTQIVKTIEKHTPVYGRHGLITYQISNNYVYDTVSTSYFYYKGKLILKRFHDGANYYESRYYRYNANGNLTKELRYKETNNSSTKTTFMLGYQVLLSEDSFQFQKLSNGNLKCIFLNSENRPYKERLLRFDTLGKTLGISDHYVAAGWIKQEHSFNYLNNRLIMAQFEGNANNNVVLKHTYEYDEQNDVYSEKQFRNDLLLKEISYVNDKISGLLNSIIIRDPINKTMRIIRLKYDFGLIGKTGTN